ncbi:LacI family DNA-binding transcriptional regulator [Fredinandcohnia sp. SECRCQ15]|uniref:LacI family DNA-binding transcriptional regulator n=2 Tax=Fredinandcohnia quinoae TaxID=2918902 RepID=A0AAW5DZ62_9BACI|nr:LacI family DNA-binding transcriptional regulator [Fredinandcohnia sp. SECRCQ15]
MKPTIKDIARLANVSITTVSRVLNGHPYVAKDKRKKVEEVIQQLDYKQNTNAIHLVKGKTNTIAVIVPYINHPFFQTLVEGIIEEAIQSGYTPLLCPTNYDPKLEMNYFQMLRSKQIDGVILCSRANEWDVIIPFLQYGPIVTCEYTEHDIPCVYIDYYQTYKDALHYVHSQGHTEIGYSIGRHMSMNTKERLRAYRAFLNETGIELNPDWIVYDCFSMEDGKNIVRELVNLDCIPSVILVNGDEVAAGVLLQAKNENISISVIGADNQPISEVLNISTIDQHIEEIGNMAFSLFKNGGTSKIPIKAELIVR